MKFDLKNYELILASNSARRKDFFKRMNIPFKVKKINFNESYPKNLKGNEIVKYILKKKANTVKNKLKKNQIILVADTIVLVDEMLLGKPNDKKSAFKMIKSLSGKTHKVITAVGFLYEEKFERIISSTKVTFNQLKNEEIEFYVEKYDPIDKAGGYGIQDWIGEIGVKKIIGSYTNVVGLPSAQVYQKIKNIVNKKLIDAKKTS